MKKLIQKQNSLPHNYEYMIIDNGQILGPIDDDILTSCWWMFNYFMDIDQ